MKRKQIDRFFKVLSHRLGRKSSVIVTGAAAGSLWGQIRPSMDIDFAIRLSKAGSWEEVVAAVDQTTSLTGIPANYAEDIDRWGMISLTDYGSHTHPYKRFGKLEVRLLEPAYWSIGKMSRYLDTDIRDMLQVLKKNKIAPSKLAKVWGRALKLSPRSTALAQFKKQVEDFLKNQGRKIWGRKFHPEEALAEFYRAAGIR